jgi:hypothetical protein
MSRVYVKSNLNRACQQTLGQAGTASAKRRQQTIHNRVTPRISKPCAEGRHFSCYMLACVCNKCGHDKTRLTA